MRKILAFTLAEMLITMVILGVVAVMTIPNLIADYQERQYKIQSTNFERKLAEALNVMNAQNNLKGFTSTRAFLEELSKNFKISKICDNVEYCFSPKIYKEDEKTSIDISEYKTSESLSHEEFETDVMGVQFANGITAVVAYNPYFTTNSDVTQITKIDEGKLHLVKIRTNVLSMIYDVSGYEKPNTVGKDIFGINTSSVGNSCVEYGSYCVNDLGNDYTAIACTGGLNANYCGTASGNTSDYWAGGNKTCDDLKMRMPTYAELLEIYNISKKSGNNFKGEWYWSSEQISGRQGCAKGVNFKTGSATVCGAAGDISGGKGNSVYNVMCIK